MVLHSRDLALILDNSKYSRYLMSFLVFLNIPNLLTGGVLEVPETCQEFTAIYTGS